MSAVERTNATQLLRVVAPRVAALAERQQGGRSRSVETQLLPRLQGDTDPFPRLSAARGVSDRTLTDGGALAGRGGATESDDRATEREVRELRQRVDALEAQTEDDSEDDPGEVF